jgi:curved DNA-binding protein CbpA
LVRSSDAYTTLGVDQDADDAAIAAAYRTLARRYHPDVAGDGATAAMMRINAAFDRIRTPERRDDYDRELDEDESARPIQRRRRARTTEPARSRAGAAAAARPGTGWTPPTATHPVDPAAWRSGWVPERDGTGGAGPPPGRPSGTVLPFGRHVGWSIGEIARADPGYLVWLEERHEGRPYRAEIDTTLRATGYRHDQDSRAKSAKGGR